MLRHDYIGRLIQQISELLARVAGLRGESRTQEADAELEAAERAVGLPVGVERLEARSVAMLIGGGDKVVIAALILEQKALNADARLEPKLASTHRARALALLAHAKPFELADQARELAARLVTYPSP
jgi:hypothetical protein